MTYERLIVAIDNEASHVSDIAYKLLWRLVAIAIQRGTPEIEASVRWLSGGLALSKEGTARAIRELSGFIKVTPSHGAGTVFSLPPDWFPPQRTLFSEDRLGGNINDCPNPQDSTVLFPRTPLSRLPGHHCPGSQDSATPFDPDCPNPQDTTVLASRTHCPISQDSGIQDNAMGTRARVDRSIDPIEGEREILVRVDRAVQTVDILPNQRESAELLRSTLIDYRDSFPGKSRQNAVPDDTVIAHCLAIADVEELCGVLRTLHKHGRAPGASDMWFFFTFCEKILAAQPKLVHARMAEQKSKARSYKNPPGLFEAQLLDEVKGKIRRVG